MTDHHTYGTRPFQKLHVVPEAPILPHGYIGTISMVMFDNRGFRRQAEAELERLKLGPFRETPTA